MLTRVRDAPKVVTGIKRLGSDDRSGTRWRYGHSALILRNASRGSGGEAPLQVVWRTESSNKMGLRAQRVASISSREAATRSEGSKEGK